MTRRSRPRWGGCCSAGQGEAWLEGYLEGVALAAITPRTIVDSGRLGVELRRVRRQGFALVDQELEEGLRALAVPIREPGGAVVGAVNVAVHTSRWTVEAIRGGCCRGCAQPPPPSKPTSPASGRRVTDVPAAAAGAPWAGAGLGRVEREPDFVQSLQRGLAVIRAFDAERPALSLSEVARATGLARAAARRFLLTLVELGYVRFDGRLFRLSPRVLELGRPYLDGLTLPEVAEPHLRELVAAVRESATVAVLDGTDIVYVAHVPAKRIMSVSVAVGVA